MKDEEFVAHAILSFPNSVEIGKVTRTVRMYGPAWDMLREWVWNRDGRKCVNCLCPVTLEKGGFQGVHCAHRKSKGSGGSDVPSNLRSLCIRCHAAEHSGKVHVR